MELDSITDSIPPELIYDGSYFIDPRGAQLQGLIMGALIAGVIIFKVLDKLKAPTEKPAKKDKPAIQTAVRAVSDIGDRIKLSLMIRLAYIIDFFISLKKGK